MLAISQTMRCLQYLKQSDTCNYSAYHIEPEVEDIFGLDMENLAEDYFGDSAGKLLVPTPMGTFDRRR